VILGYQVYWYIYNLYFHPLAAFPGPKLWAASRIPHELAYTRGRIVKELSVLHEKYGDVVRVSPTSLSFIHPDAWMDIYTRKAGKQLFQKDPIRYTRDLWINGEPEVFTAPDSEHTRLRRVLAPAFSDKAIRDQEALIQANVDLLVTRLKGLAHNSETKGNADLSTWLNWATFDITGDLAFGEPFGCLEAGKYHAWVALVFDSVWAVSIMGAIKQFPWLDFVFELLMGGVMRRTLASHTKLAIEKVDRRLTKKEDRGDFLDAILKHSGSEKEFTRGEIYSNANLLIMAGSETSATAMAGCLYHLAKTPQVMSRLTDETRGRFPAEKDITFQAVADMPYMTAVLQESMRLYPAQPIFTPRRVPEGGAIVAGYSVPEYVSIILHCGKAA
jgi:cytochrome P450